MAAALASRATVGLALRSAALVKALSTSTATPSHTVIDSENTTKLRRKKKKNLFEVAQFLPNWGIGYKLAKSHWRDVSYQLTKINLYKVPRLLVSLVILHNLAQLRFFLFIYLSFVINDDDRMAGMVRLGGFATKLVFLFKFSFLIFFSFIVNTIWRSIYYHLSHSFLCLSDLIHSLPR